MRIPTLALYLVSILPCAGAVAAPFDIPSSHVSVEYRRVRVSLINLSGQHRQVRVTSGLLDLPFGVLVDVDSQIGETLNVVSDMDQSLDQQIVVKRGDDARILAIR
ncbi:MAG TPA: hypothetical protein VK814_03475 [Acidobacteriaceae bacterium]|nr:hypothetical protein [Acidobacteriaceae bacterium]